MPDQKRLPAPRWSILLVILWFWGIYLTLRLMIFGFRTFFGIMGLLIGPKKTDLKSRFTLHTSAAKQQQHPSTSSGDNHEASSSSPPNCPICHERIGKRNAEGIREGWSVLPCGHRFGSYCIKHYLGLAADEEPACPICRKPAFHGVCGHPVLPFVLRADGTHPDLVLAEPSSSSAASGKLLPVKGEHFHSALACGYCVPPPTTTTSGDKEATPLWRAPLSWLWSKTPFASSERRHRCQRRGSVGERPSRRSILRERRERIRNQRDGGAWQGPWVDVRVRDVGWEEWWKEQVPRGA